MTSFLVNCCAYCHSSVCTLPQIAVCPLFVIPMLSGPILHRPMDNDLHPYWQYSMSWQIIYICAPWGSYGENNSIKSTFCGINVSLNKWIVDNWWLNLAPFSNGNPIVGIRVANDRLISTTYWKNIFKMRALKVANCLTNMCSITMWKHNRNMIMYY